MYIYVTLSLPKFEGFVSARPFVLSDRISVPFLLPADHSCPFLRIQFLIQLLELIYNNPVGHGSNCHSTFSLEVWPECTGWAKWNIIMLMNFVHQGLNYFSLLCKLHYGQWGHIWFLLESVHQLSKIAFKIYFCKCSIRQHVFKLIPCQKH